MTKLLSELKQFQQETVDWMITQESKYDGGLLLNSAGTGKTICVLATIINNPMTTLIVCPAVVIDNWINEIEKQTNISKCRIVRYYGPKRHIKYEEPNKKIIYITSYSIVCKEFNGASFEKTSHLNSIKFDRLVLDEAHYIRNTYNNTYKSISALPVRIKWVVTATPIFNDPNDAFAYFKLLGLEGIDTKSDWTKSIQKNVNGLHKLNNWIKKYGISFQKDKVLKELKAKKEIVCKLEFNDSEKEFYNSLKEYSQLRLTSLVKRMGTNAIPSMYKLFHSNVMVYILRLKQACNSPELILRSMERLKQCSTIEDAVVCLKFYNESKNIEEECPICYDTTANYIAKPCGHKCCEGCWNKMFNMNIIHCPKCRVLVEEIEKVEKDNVVAIVDTTTTTTTGTVNINSSKVDKIIRLTKDALSKNEKMVIVSQWVGMLDIIRNNEFFNTVKYVSLQGSISLNKRTESINQFQNNPDIKVCFISLMSSAEGINLVSSCNLILVDSWWNDAKMTQVMDRIHRIGQPKNVNIYKLQMKNSIEEQIEQLITKKRKMAGLVLTTWKIRDTSKYDDTWMNNIVKLIESKQSNLAPPRQPVDEYNRIIY